MTFPVRKQVFKSIKLNIHYDESRLFETENMTLQSRYEAFNSCKHVTITPCTCILKQVPLNQTCNNISLLMSRFKMDWGSLHTTWLSLSSNF